MGLADLVVNPVDAPFPDTEIPAMMHFTDLELAVE
jgi:hypothetical protein